MLSQKGYNSVKMTDGVSFSCVQVEVMLVKMYAKYQSNMSVESENILGCK